MKGDTYRVWNVADQDIELKYIKDGRHREYVFKHDDVLEGLSERTVGFLRKYEKSGLIRIEKEEIESGLGIWLKEGF